MLLVDSLDLGGLYAPTFGSSIAPVWPQVEEAAERRASASAERGMQLSQLSQLSQLNEGR